MTKSEIIFIKKVDWYLLDLIGMAKAMADAGATRKSNVITEKGFN